MAAAARRTFRRAELSAIPDRANRGRTSRDPDRERRATAGQKSCESSEHHIEWMTEPVDVNVAVVDSILPDRNGKLQDVVSLLADQ